jgi:hypothetical protein
MIARHLHSLSQFKGSVTFVAFDKVIKLSDHDKNGQAPGDTDYTVAVSSPEISAHWQQESSHSRNIGLLSDREQSNWRSGPALDLQRSREGAKFIHLLFHNLIHVDVLHQPDSGFREHFEMHR